MHSILVGCSVEEWMGPMTCLFTLIDAENSSDQVGHTNVTQLLKAKNNTK